MRDFKAPSHQRRFCSRRGAAYTGSWSAERHARAGVRGSWNSSASGVLTESESERYRNSQRVEKYIRISVGTRGSGGCSGFAAARLSSSFTTPRHLPWPGSAAAGAHGASASNRHDQAEFTTAIVAAGRPVVTGDPFLNRAELARGAGHCEARDRRRLASQRPPPALSD